MAKRSALGGLEKLFQGMLGDLWEIKQAVGKLLRAGKRRPKRTGIQAGVRAGKRAVAARPKQIRNKGKRCAAPGCGKWARARGFCSNHYQQMRRRLEGGPAQPKRGRPRVEPKVCSVRGCSKVVVARGLCATHYQFQRRKRMRREKRKLGSGL